MSKPIAYKVKAYSATSASSPLAPTTIPRRELTDRDVQIDILYCGVCHSDLHFSRNEWGFTQFPAVAGHEIIGRVTKVGSAVTKFKAGDIAGVGCMVDADLSCPQCRKGLEQFSPSMIMTYGSADKHLNLPTYGGYSEGIVVDEHFVLRVPANLDQAAVAPLLCAGITTYSPLRHWKVGPGKKVGIVGLGGLGHMAVKFANAFGAHVVVFTTSPGKTEDALRLGAHEVAYLGMLALDGNITLVGAPEKPLPVAPMALIFGRKSLSGSLIGGIAETQEMLDFCGEHGITCDVEMIRMDQINEAYERMLKSDVKYRFVIDMTSLKAE